MGLILPDYTIGANIGIGAVDQQHIGPCRCVLHDGGVEGGRGENRDIIVHVVDQNRYRSCSTQRWRT